ncbi:MAG: hypothetical protein LBR00_06035, partial [Clostridiales Family XIII bacterium]|nr:hypothetical protein [Clostridiales Family XIII bacterium]
AGTSVTLPAPTGAPTMGGGTYAFLGYDTSATATAPMYPASLGSGPSTLALITLPNVRADTAVYAIWGWTLDEEDTPTTTKKVKEKETKAGSTSSADGGSGSATSSTSKKTGDETPLGLLLALLAIAAAGMVLLVLRLRRRRAAGCRPYGHE